MKMRNIFHILIGLLLLNACKSENHDYSYTLINKAETYSPITVVYQVTDEKADTVILTYGDVLKLANRMDVTGEDVWDIETSVSLYKIKTLQIFSHDSSHISEELAYRRSWEGPEDINGVGNYKLVVEDSLIMLSKQNNYTYVISNTFDDTLFVISDITSKGRAHDTLIGQGSYIIGSTDIYTYDESLKDLPKYKTQKLKWLTALNIRHNGKSKALKMSKDTSFFRTDKDTCYLTVSDLIFN